MENKEIQELGFELRSCSDDELVYENVFGEVEVSLHIMNRSTFYLSYDNGFIHCTTSTEYSLDSSIKDILNPFLYNITRLKTT